MNHLLVSLAFSMVVVLATAHGAPLQRDARQAATIPLNALYSESTERFVTITEGGEVHANGNIGSAESQFYTTFSGNQLRLQSAKVETCFLLFNNSEFVGGVPSLTDNNDLFEIVQLEFNMIALRVVNPMYSQQNGSGASAIEETHTEMANTEEVQAEEVANTEESVVSECYLGFDRFGKPECYDSTDDRATKFILIHLN